MAWGETIGSVGAWAANIYGDYTASEKAKAEASTAKQSVQLEQAKGIFALQNKEKLMLYGSLGAIGLVAIYVFSGKKR